METKLLSFEIIDLPLQGDSISGLEESGARDILILYEPFTDANLLVFLERVLRAAQIDLTNDTQHRAFSADAAPSFVLLDRTVRFHTLLAFGFTPKDFGLQFNWNFYTPVDFKSKTLLFCDPLPLLMEERARGGSERSGPFWKALQHIFLKK